MAKKTIVTQKTADFIKMRDGEDGENSKNAKNSILKAQDLLNQFTQIKRIVNNFTFEVDNKRMLCNDIVVDVMDELRRERKILMVLEDRDVDLYVTHDMTEVDMNN